MRVLVTGAGGFVGGALVPVLVERGCELTLTDWNCDGIGNHAAARIVPGDIADEQVQREAIRDADAVIHLATVPGGAAEDHPDLASRINVAASMSLSRLFAAARPSGPFVFASSVAVLGHPLPPAVDDGTPLAPRMLYGTHKAMVETWLAALSRRGELSAISLRLPGIVARPQAPSGMKSAFISNVFHAITANRPIELPVSAGATMWLMSVRQVAICLVDGLSATFQDLPAGRAVTLPALRVSMAELVAEICRQRDATTALVRYNPHEAIETGFGRQPPLQTPTASSLGFSHDGDIGRLVRSALEALPTKERQ